MHGRDSPVKAKRPDGRSGRAAKQTQARAHLTSTFHDSRFSPDVKHESPQTPHADRDLDALLATVRGAYFDARRAGDLAQAAELAGTYRQLYGRKLRPPAPATIPTPMPDRATWAAWRKRRDIEQIEARIAQLEAQLERDRLEDAESARRLEELTGGWMIWDELEVAL